MSSGVGIRRVTGSRAEVVNRENDIDRTRNGVGVDGTKGAKRGRKGKGKEVGKEMVWGTLVGMGRKGIYLVTRKGMG